MENISKYQEWFILRNLVFEQMKTLSEKVIEGTKSKKIAKKAVNEVVSNFLSKDEPAKYFFNEINATSNPTVEKIRDLNPLSANDYFILFNYLNKILMNEKFIKEAGCENVLGSRYKAYCALVFNDMMPFFDGFVELTGMPAKEENDKKALKNITCDMIGEILYDKNLEMQEKIDKDPKLNCQNIKIHDTYTGLNFGKYTSYVKEKAREHIEVQTF